MAILYVASTSKQGGPSSVTTNSVNTDGANLIVLSVSSTGASRTILDSYNNNYTALTERNVGVTNTLYYCVNPTVGSDHTFTVNGGFVAVSMVAVSGANSVQTPLQNGSTASSATSIQPGSISPTVNGSLIVSGLGFDGSTGQTINLGFTQLLAPFQNAVNYGNGIGWLIQSSAAPINPTWSWTSGVNAGSTIAVFTPNTFTPTPSGVPRYPTVGQNDPVDASGGDSWTNPGNIFSDNGLLANSVIGQTGFTRFLEGRGFGFSLASDVTVKGIVAEIEMHDNSSAGMGQVYKVQLIKNGLYVGNQKGAGTSIGVTPEVYSFGSPTDLWGTTWTPADINSANFGVGFAAVLTMQFGNADINVDFIRLNVYYADPSIPATAALSKTVTLVAKGTSVVPKKNATASLSKKASVAAIGTVQPPKFYGTANLSKRTITDADGMAAASMSFSQTHLATKSAVLSGSGTTSLPVFRGTANLSKAVVMEETSTYTQRHSGISQLYKFVLVHGLGKMIIDGGNLSTKSVRLVGIGTSEVPRFEGTANLSTQPVRLTNVGLAVPPFFQGRAFLSTNEPILSGVSNSTRMQMAVMNMVIRGARHEVGGVLDMYIQGADLPVLNKMSVASLPMYMNSAYLAGGKMDMFVEGYSVLRPISATMNMFLSADYPVASSHLDFYLMSDIPQLEGILPMIIRGAGVNVGYYYAGRTLNLFVEGEGSGDLTTPVFNQATMDLFMKGAYTPVLSYNNSLPIFLKGVDANVKEGALDMVIEGANPNLITQNLDLVIYSTLLRETLPMFIRGI